MNTAYIVLCVVGLVILICSLFFIVPWASKIFDNENFAFENKSLSGLGGIFFKLLLVAIPFLGICLLILWLENLFGMPSVTQEDGAKAMLLPFIASLILPLLIFCVLTPIKTRKLAKNGNIVAGYLSYKLNPRFNLLRVQYSFLMSCIFVLGCAIITIPTLDSNYVVKRDPVKAIIAIVVIAIFWAFVGYSDRILYYIMKKVLGEYFNTDYTLPINRAKKLGVSEEDFYKTMFTKGQLKLLEKDKK